MDYNETNYSGAVFHPGDTITFNYTGNYNTIALPPGKFLIECWGAAGGHGGTNPTYRGFGGYSVGEIEFIQSQELFAYVGEFGMMGLNRTSGFNGGARTSSYGGNHDGGRGGGASDIRLIGGIWSDINSLRSRIIIAGGGGGSQPNCGGYSLPGHGGGLIGGTSVNPSGSYAGAAATGGSQTLGGSGNRTPIANGGFGFGGICSNCGAGGGGGYYGGGSCYTAGGGGGSSFISGMEGCNAIDASGNHTGQAIHYSNLTFNNPYMEVGVRDNHGLIRITFISSSSKILFYIDNQIKYFKNNHFNILNKNIDNLTSDDFLMYGTDPLNVELDANIDNVTVLSMSDTLLYKTQRNATIIYDHPLTKKRLNINKVSKITVNDIGNIIYMIHNGDKIYSWKNNEWGIYHCNTNIFSSQDISNMIKYGMSSTTINNISENNWDELWTSIDSYKYINFLAILNPQNTGDEIILKDIEITKDSFSRQIEIKDYMFEEKNMPEELILTWNTTNKSKIKIIYEM